MLEISPTSEAATSVGAVAASDSLSLERRLVRHVHQRTYADLPWEALDAARREVFWTLGTSVAGAWAEGSDRIMAFVRGQSGTPEATVWGHGLRVPATLAGFANGCFAKALEYEDKWWLDHGHAYAIGTSVVPAALATAEQIGGIDGRRLIEAVALATDVQARLVQAVPNGITTSWNASYLWAAFGAAMVAGKLMRLSEDALMSATGLAYAQAAGNRESLYEGVFANRVQMGFGVRNGLTAAQLARLGVEGPQQFLTGKFGVFPAFFKDTSVDLGVLTDALGVRYEGASLGFKAYPCCAAMHPALDAIFALLAEHTVAAEAILSINVSGTTRMRITVDPPDMKRSPQSHVEAQFSMPWALACALIDRKLSLTHFSAQALRDLRYRALAGKVTADMSSASEGVRIEVRLVDGTVLHSPTVLAAKGHPENPLSTDELVDRFRDCLAYGPNPVPPDRADQIKDLVLALDGVSDVSAIARLTAG